MGRHNAAFVVIVLCLMFILYIAVTDTSQYKSITESFEEGDTEMDLLDEEDPLDYSYQQPDLNVISDDTLFEDNDVKFVPIDRELPSRPCVVYHTPETELCDQGKFDIPMSWYESQIAQPSLPPATRDYYNRIVNAYKRLPNGDCSTDFPGWIEPLYNPNVPKGEPRQILPLKNSTSSDLGAPGDWSYCFAPVANNAEAKAKGSFADGKAINNDSETGGAFQSPFNNSKVYSRIKFNTLNISTKPTRYDMYGRADNLNDMLCSLPVNMLDIPPSYLVFMLDGSRVRDVFPVRYDKTNGTSKGTLIDYTDEQSRFIRQNLFTTELTSSGLYLSAKSISTTVHRFEILCQRVSKVLGTSRVSYSFQVPRNNDYLLYTSTDELTRGTYDQLKARLLEYQRTLDTRKAAYDQVNNEVAAATGSQYTRGLYRTRYLLANGQRANRSAGYSSDLTSLFESLTPSSAGVTTTKPKFICSGGLVNLRSHTSMVDSTVKDFEDDCRDPLRPNDNTFMAIQYEGFILAPETGDYSFAVNSDDAADIQVNGQTVASYYGHHGTLWGGTNGTTDVTPTYIQTVISGYGAAANKSAYVQQYQLNFVEPIESILNNASSTPAEKAALLQSVAMTMKIRLESGKYYPIRIRIVQAASTFALAVYWLLPSKRNMLPAQCSNKPELRVNGVPVPANMKCYDEIPENRFYYNTAAVGGNPILRAAKRDYDSAKTNVARLKGALTTIRSEFIKKVKYFFFANAQLRELNALTTMRYDPSYVTKVNTFDDNGKAIQQSMICVSAEEVTADIDSKLNLDFDPSDLDLGSRGLPFVIQDAPVDLSNYSQRIPANIPGFDFNKVTYTISMFIKIDNLCRFKRNLFFFGANMNDPTPSISVFDNNRTFIEFRQSLRGDATRRGCDLVKVRPPLRKWFHFAAVVDQTAVGQYIKIYYNGMPAGSSGDGIMLNANADDPPTWNRQNGRQKFMYLNNLHYEGGWNTSTCGAVSVRQVTWYTTALKNQDIQDIYNEAEFIDRTTVDYSRFFRLQDTTSGQFLKYNIMQNVVTEDLAAADMYLDLDKNVSVFKPETKTVAVKDVSSDTYLAVTDARDQTLRQSVFAPNSSTNSWIFIRTDNPNEYIIKSWSNTLSYLEFDGYNALIRPPSGPAARKWRVVGTPAVQAAVAAVSVANTEAVFTPATPFFQLQDVATGRFMMFRPRTNEISLDTSGADATQFEMRRDSTVYRFDTGTVALRDTSKNLFIRHSGFTLRLSPYANNNYDYAWIFVKTSTPNEYTIRNWYGGTTWIEYNGNVVLIQGTKTPRRWRVVGHQMAMETVARNAVNA